jgi:S-DNA-T family DNA segregation ATPase FtsK/SpoIIIE
MAERKTTTKKKPTKAELERLAARKEAQVRLRKQQNIRAIALFALGLLFTAFAVIELEEPAWSAVRNFLQSLFGVSMYLFGVLLIFVAIRKKIFTPILVFLLVCALLHIIGDLGGAVGWLVSYPLMFFGRIGAGIIVVLIGFVFVMLTANITLESFLRFVITPFRKAGSYAKQQRELHRLEAEERREEHCRERLRQAECDIKRDIDSDVKFESIISALPPAVPENKEEIELPFPLPEIVTEEIVTEEIVTEEIPAEGTSGGSPPPFDLPGEQPEPPEPFDEAIRTFRQEAEDEEAERQMHEESFAEPEIPEPEPPKKSDFDAYAAFAAHQQLYSLPEVELLDNTVKKRPESDIQAELDANSVKLVETLQSFGVKTRIVGVVRGPTVTRYEIQPAPGVKISKITSLTDDIALNLAAAGVRMEAPIPGKSAVGVEVPNLVKDSVFFRELIDSNDFRETKSNLGAALGKSISGDNIISDIAKMPHVLIAGTTGSGKSVCVNSIIMSILYRATPVEVRLMMIDPKVVEFAIYSGIPHLLTPVVTDPQKAAGALGWAVGEMEQRYELFAENSVRDIGGYNELAKKSKDSERELEPMAKIVIFIDELADLMMTAAKEVESNICRLAQKARAAGIHLVIATQRPSVNVVTGLIKANIPSRIALKVASQVDSRTIIDTAGADKLLGNGDMLYAPVGAPKPIRVQGCFVSDDEVARVVKHTKDSFDFDYDMSVVEEIERQALVVAEKESKKDDDFDMDDDRLEEAIEAVIDAGKASTSYLQMKLKLGYGRAARIMDIMERMGVIGKSQGVSKPREVLMTRQDWLERKLHR